MDYGKFCEEVKPFLVQSFKIYVSLLAFVYLKSLSDRQENLKAYQELVNLKVIPIKPPVLFSHS